MSELEGRVESSLEETILKLHDDNSSIGDGSECEVHRAEVEQELQDLLLQSSLLENPVSGFVAPLPPLVGTGVQGTLDTSANRVALFSDGAQEALDGGDIVGDTGSDDALPSPIASSGACPRTPGPSPYGGTPLHNIVATGASLANTLREMRRAGPLGELSDHAQTVLLGGALYEYGDESVEASRTLPASSVHSTLGGSSLLPPSAQSVSSRGADAREDSGELSLADIRNSLDRILQLRNLAARATRSEGGSFVDAPDEIDPSRSSHAGIEADAQRTVNWLEGNLSRSGALDASPDRSASLMTRSGFSILSAERHLAEEPSRALSAVAEADDEGLVSVNAALGNSTMTEGSMGQSVHTVFGETLSPEGGLDAGFVGVLRRLALDSAFDESLVRTARRLLQLGAVLAGQRLSDEEIYALPKVRFESAEEQACAICLEPYNQGELLTALRCNHFFHVDCLTRWFQRSTQCPLCRAPCGD